MDKDGHEEDLDKAFEYWYKKYFGYDEELRYDEYGLGDLKEAFKQGRNHQLLEGIFGIPHQWRNEE